MKKNYNIEEIERWAQKGFSDAEKHLRYEAKRVPYTGAEKAAAARAKERGGARFSPALKIAGAFLALVLTGGAMFGGLKFLEYKGAQNLAEQGSGTPGTSQGEKTPGADNNISNADEAPAVEPAEYDPNDKFGGKFVYVKSGDKVYQPFVCSESLMAVINYVTPVFDYSGRLNIVNNVKDRDWTVLSSSFWFAGIERFDRTFDGMDINQICDYIDHHDSDRYTVTLKVTWDDPNDENAVIYYVDFVIRRTAESEVTETVEPVEYDPKGQNHPNYLYVTSGDKVYHPFIHNKSATVKVGYDSPTFEYNGKISFVNNVKDRDWHILTLYSTDPEKPGGFTYYTRSDGIIEDITLTEPGTYFFYAEVTWDDPDDENAVIYFVEFYITNGTESDKFEDVTEFDLTDNGNAKAISPYRIECEAAEALGFNISYDMRPTPPEYNIMYYVAGIKITNGYNTLTVPYDVKKVLYAAKTPSGHPMMFYFTNQLVSGPDWVYADLYAYDLTTEENYLVISVGPVSYMSMSNIRVYGELSYENGKILASLYEETHADIWNPHDKKTWSDPFATEPIKWNGEKYVVEGIDPARYLIENSGADTGTDVYVDPVTDTQDHSAWQYDPSGWVLVKSGSNQCAPAVTGYYKGSVRESYNIDIPVLEYDENSTIEILNNVRTTWHLADVGIDGKPIRNLANFGEYLKTLPINPENDAYLNFVIYAHWDAAEDNTDIGIFEFSFKLLIKGTPGKQHTDIEPSGYAKFAVIVDKYAIAPYEYKEYDKVEVNEVNVTLNPAPDVIPVIDVYALGEYETIKYSYDTEAVTHVETRMGAYGGGTMLYNSPGGILADARSMLRIPGASNVLYVESVFQKKDGSGKYISYIFAVSGGDPACYPFSSDGDGAAHFTVSDDNNTYAPRAKYFYCSDRSVIENSRFTELNLPYYKVPTVVLTGGLEFKMKDGYHISKVIAFKDTKATEQQVYHGIEGLHLSTWLSKQPWGEFYAAVIVEKDGEESEGKGYLTAYVIKVVLASPSSDPELKPAVDHTAQITELQSWLSQRMWNGMNESELLNTAVKGKDKDLKNSIMAAAYDQFDLEDDGTFVRYKTEYCDFLYFAEKDTFRIREARLILYPGTSFSLPFGITLDMSPEEALSAMGYTEEEAESLNGGTVNEGGYGVSYNNGFLNITFVYNDVCLGIELGGGSQAQAYIEMG